jgi:NADPH:quinone reductase-like Zn-dependent oxidoreductase
MVETMMKAAQITAYGGPEVLKVADVPRPRPQADEVLVHVHGAAINSIDWKISSGLFRHHMPPRPFPYIPGEEIAGVIEEIGPGVKEFQVGQEVYGIVRHAHQGSGYAEYITTIPQHLAPKPACLDFNEAASVPVGALTAWQALFDHGGLTAGQRVLIHNAAGAVGIFAIQLARWKGAQIYTTTSTPNVDFARSLGADVVIDYQTTRFEEVVNEVDLVLDGVGGETRERSWQVLKKGGMLVTITGPIDENTAKKHGVRAHMFTMNYNTDQHRQITSLIEAGILKTELFKVFPLDQAQEAYALSMQAHGRGKIVLCTV